MPDDNANVEPIFTKPTMAVVIVDPDMARRWLGRNTHNRRIRSRVVSAYARDMAAGDWQMTGEAVKFDTAGVLVDGQHRLLAIVEADVAVPLFVVRGIAPQAQDVMDTGSRRLAGDVLSLHGHESAALLAAAAKWAILYDTERLYIDRAARAITHSEIVDYVTDNPELDDAVRLAASMRKHIDLQPSLLVVCIYLTARRDPAASREFFVRVADGIGLDAGSPVLALRSRLRQIKNDRSRVEPEALMSLTIRAWNAYREGRKLASIPVYRGKSSIRCPEPK